MEILVGIDGTEHGLAATRWAAREARTVDAPLTLLHVYSVPAVPSPAGPVRMPEQQAKAKEEAEAFMRRAHQVAREELAGSTVPLSDEVLQGPPITTLLEMSKSARMLVLGSHSGAIFRHRLGSVVSTCLHKASCPVVVVPVEVVNNAAGSSRGAAASSSS